MQNNGLVNLEEYKKDACKISSGIGINNIAGNKSELIYLIMSTIPMTDEDDEKSYVVDFPETSPYVFDENNRSASRAILFTGQSGNGKHTAERIFASELYKYIRLQFEGEGISGDELTESINESFKYYKIPIYELVNGTKEQSCEKIEELFSQLTKMAVSDWEYVMYVSFGDITDIMESKKTAKCFSRCIEALQHKANSSCIITCIYQDKSSRLKENIKKPFIIKEFEKPAIQTRREYFENFIRSHFNIILAYDAKKLSELTEDFSFRMLSRVTERIVMRVKGELIIDKAYDTEEYMDFLINPDIVESYKIKITEAEIQAFIDEVKNCEYTAKEMQSHIPLMSVTEPAPFVRTQSEKAADKPENNVNIYDNIEKPETFEQLYQMKERLFVPLGISTISEDTKADSRQTDVYEI